MAITDNLISSYKCDETSGTTATDAANAHNATLNANSSFSSGLVVSTTTNAHGGATMGQVTAQDLTSYPVTMSAVFKTSTNTAQTNGNMKIGINLEKATSPYSQISCVMIMDATANKGKLEWRYRDSSGNDYVATTSATYNDGNEHFFVGTIDGSGNMVCYVDGSSAATATASGSVSTGKWMMIANDNYNNTNTANSVWVGTQRNMSLWDRCLSSTEVTTLWNSGTPLLYPFSASPVAPTVTSSAVTSIGSTTATGNGNVTSDGGSTITERGVVIGTSANPTTSNSKFTTSGTTGSFTASITGLTASTAYHCRAYAINAQGTSYGSDQTFTSTSGSSSVTITPATTTTIGTATIDTIVVNFH